MAHVRCRLKRVSILRPIETSPCLEDFFLPQVLCVQPNAASSCEVESVEVQDCLWASGQSPELKETTGLFTLLSCLLSPVPNW